GIGDAVIIVDGDGREADGRVVAIDAAAARVAVGPARAAARPVPRITVAQALVKGERMDWCAEKLAECGADAIVLVSAARSVVRPAGAGGAGGRDGLASLARAAARQSQRPIPTVDGPVPLAEALARAASADVRFLCHPAAHDVPLAVPDGAREVVLLVG